MKHMTKEAKCACSTDAQRAAYWERSSFGIPLRTLISCSCFYSSTVYDNLVLVIKRLELPFIAIYCHLLPYSAQEMCSITMKTNMTTEKERDEI